jgi:hypothetical protein
MAKGPSQAISSLPGRCLSRSARNSITCGLRIVPGNSRKQKLHQVTPAMADRVCQLKRVVFGSKGRVRNLRFHFTAIRRHTPNTSRIGFSSAPVPKVSSVCIASGARASDRARYAANLPGPSALCVPRTSGLAVHLAPVASSSGQPTADAPHRAGDFRWVNALAQKFGRLTTARKIAYVISNAKKSRRTPVGFSWPNTLA